MGELFDYRPMKSNWSTYHRGQKNKKLLHADLEMGGFLLLDECYSLHESININAESLKKSWMINLKYYQSTFKDNILNMPKPCFPIYIFSVGDGEEEKVVYIGKTASQHGRFKNGHKVCILLHNSKYDGLSKKLYQCSIQFLNKQKNILPIEWLQPLEYGLDILSKVEAMLIHEFQPEFNIHYKKI